MKVHLKFDIDVTNVPKKIIEVIEKKLRLKFNQQDEFLKIAEEAK